MDHLDRVDSDEDKSSGYKSQSVFPTTVLDEEVMKLGYFLVQKSLNLIHPYGSYLQLQSRREVEDSSIGEPV